MEAAWDGSPRLGEALRALEWERVVAAVVSATETPMGHALADAWQPALGSAAIVYERQQNTREADLLITAAGLTLAGAVSIGELAERAARSGLLSGTDLYQVAVTLARAKDAVGAVAGVDGLAYWPRQMAPWKIPAALQEALIRAIAEDGTVRDGASPKLAQIRAQERECMAAIDTIFERLLRSPTWQTYLQEPVVTIRYGRRVVPVRHEFRSKVAGVVQDVSGSGQTVFVEPQAVINRSNQLARLEREEEQEVERILREFSVRVGAERQPFGVIQEGLAGLDVGLAMARYGRALGGTFPELGGAELTIEQGRHPLLTGPVPLSISLSPEQNVIMITGPNTGGKTVALKATGLLVAMGLSGMMVPAGAAQIPVYTQIYVDIGDEQSLLQSLSTFSAHLRRIVPMVEAAEGGQPGPVLALIDEIGAGTDPEEGAALAEAVLEVLTQAGVHTLVTTHYGRLKLMAYANPRIQNAQMEFDRDRLLPTYRLIVGRPGSSHALYIARHLGMPDSVMQRARGLIGEEQRTLGAAIEAVAAIEARLQEERQGVARAEQDLARRKTEQERAEAEFLRWQDRERMRVGDEHRAKIQALVAQAEKLMAQIRDADREDRNKAVEELRQTLRDARLLPAPPRPSVSHALREGDAVRIAGFVDPGHIVELQGRTATVEVGGMRIKLGLSELSPASGAPPKASTGRRSSRSPGPDTKALTAGVELDLRGERVEDALLALDKFLDDAVLLNLQEIRIIHGKGTGALRRAVQDFLKREPRVQEYRLGGVGEGSDGVTVARL